MIKEFMKFAAVVALMVGFVVGSHAAVDPQASQPAITQTNELPALAQELIKNIEQNGMKAVVLQGDQLKAFSQKSTEAFGPKATVPADVVVLVTPDPRAFTGAGEHETANSPWPLVVFTADGHKYQAMAPRGAVETILKAVDEAA